MEVDVNKRAIYADLHITKSGADAGSLHPAKFIYMKSPDAPVTIVSMLRTAREDLYLIVGTVNPESKVATFQVHVNPLVSWIWIGCCVLIFGSIVCMWPQVVPEESRAWSFARGFAGVATSVTLGLLLAVMPAPAYAQTGMDDMHSGTIKILSEHERDIFSSLRCMCGCPRDLLSTCSCGSAEEARERIRAQIAEGKSKDQILFAYQQQYGIASLAVPPNEGALRTIYAVPFAAIVAGAVGLGVTVKRWRSRSTARIAAAVADKPQVQAEKKDEYDKRLDDELRDLDG
jgi:cytochrome c-type biogenesis protein CcmH/NrfF